MWWLQLGLNLGWSVAFFGRRRPDAGLLVIAALEPAIVGARLLASRVARAAAALLAPCAGWTAFALMLNHRITQLNRGRTRTRVWRWWR